MVFCNCTSFYKRGIETAGSGADLENRLTFITSKTVPAGIMSSPSPGNAEYGPRSAARFAVMEKTVRQGEFSGMNASSALMLEVVLVNPQNTIVFPSFAR